MVYRKNVRLYFDSVIMKIPIFVIFFTTISFIYLAKCDNKFNLLRQDLIDESQYFGTKFKQYSHKSNPKTTENDLNNYLIFINIRQKYKNGANIDLKRIARLNYDIETKKKQLKHDQVMRQHTARMKEVTDFMKDHMMTTKYLYEEVNRIKRDRKVRDSLREMVAYLERAENKEQKVAVLKFFVKNQNVHIQKKKNVWDQRVNDLVINVIKDPFNDGTIN